MALYGFLVLFLPMVLIFFVSYGFKPVFVVRIFVWMGPPTLLLVSLGLISLNIPNFAKGCVLSLLLLLSLYQTKIYFATPTQDFRSAVGFLKLAKKPGDLIVVYPNELDMGLGYYEARTGAARNFVSLPAEFPALGLSRPYLGSNKGVPLLVDSDRAAIDALLDAHKIIWRVGDQNNLLGAPDIAAQEIEKRRGKPVASWSFGGVTVTEFK